MDHFGITMSKNRIADRESRSSYKQLGIVSVETYPAEFPRILRISGIIDWNSRKHHVAFACTHRIFLRVNFEDPFSFYNVVDQVEIPHLASMLVLWTLFVPCPIHRQGRQRHGGVEERVFVSRYSSV